MQTRTQAATLDDVYRSVAGVGCDYTYALRVDPDGRFTAEWFTPEFHEIVGYRADELDQDGGWAQLVHPEDLGVLHLRRERVLAGDNDRSEFRIITKSGRTRWLRESSRPLRSEADQRVIAVFAAGSDVTDGSGTEQPSPQDPSQRLPIADVLGDDRPLLQEILDNTSAVVYLKDTVGRYLLINRRYESLFHVTRRGIIGKTDFDVFPRQVAAAFRANDEKVLSAGAPLELEEMVTHDDGMHTYISLKFPMFDPSGRAIGVCGVSTDITDRKRAEEVLRQSEAKFRSLVETMSAAAFIVQGDRIHYANAAAQAMTGYGIEALRAMQFRDLIHPNDRDFVRDVVFGLHQSHNVPPHHEVRMVTRSGVQHWVDCSAGAIDYEGNRALLATAFDITNHKTVEEKLREQGELLTQVISTTPHSIFWKDRDSVYLGCNENFARNAGVRGPEDVVGKTDYDLACRPREADVFRQRDRQVMESGEPIHDVEEPQLMADGKDATVLTSKVPLRDALGNVTGVLGMYADITERKSAEEELHRANVFLDSIVENIPDMIFVKDSEHLRFVRFNRAGEELLGRSRHELIGRNDYDFFPKQEADFFTFKDREVLDGRKLVDIPEEPIHTRNRGTRVLHTKKIPIVDEKGEPRFLLGISRDITEQKLAEELMRRQALVFDNIYDGVILTDLEGKIIGWNPASRRIFGYSKHEVLGKSTELLHRPGEAPALTRLINEEVRRSGRWSGEVCFVRRDGTEGICEAVVVPLYDERGEWTVTVSVNRDITERKRVAEQARRHQVELAHVSRLSTVGEIAASVAHELNQPLSAITNYAHGCQRRIKAGEIEAAALLHALDQVVEQARRAGQIIRRVRSFVRKSELHPVKVDINRIVREAAEFVAMDAELSHVRLRLKLADALPQIRADAIQIEQVILNLVLNGFEAMEDVEEAARELIIRTARDADGDVKVSVQDMGCGIQAELRDQIFDPFFSTKPEGMGMGLSISRSIIQHHGGRLWTTAEARRGATFHFTLPADGGDRHDDA